MYGVSSIVLRRGAVAYPELVSRGVSKTRKCKWQVKVGASNGVTPLIKQNHGRRGGFPGNQKKNLDTPLGWGFQISIKKCYVTLEFPQMITL